MFSTERHRTHSKSAVSSESVSFPESGTGGVSPYSRFRKTRQRGPRRRLLLVALIVTVVLIFCVFCWNTDFNVSGDPPPPPPQQRQVDETGSALSPAPSPMITTTPEPAEEMPTTTTTAATPTNDAPTTGTLQIPNTGRPEGEKTDTTTTNTSVAPLPPAQALTDDLENQLVETTTTTIAASTTPSQITEVEPDRRTVRPDIFQGDLSNQRENGEYQLEEPERVPRLTVQRRTYTPEELLFDFADTDYVYSFVNGTEATHEYRKEVRMACMKQILEAETASYELGYPRFLIPTSTPIPAPQEGQVPNASTTAPPQTGPYGLPIKARPRDTTPFSVLKCMPNRLQYAVGEGKTLGDFHSAVHRNARGGADTRDRETDELRHSVRSVEQHVRWHKGRLIMVSPGHHPTWVDGAKNFLAGTCGDAAVQSLRSHGTHLRLTTVHQDAVMPYGMRLTADSHVIEQHLWRVRNLTAVHVYMNDDYFVNRDVAITDLFNEYGGTIVRTEFAVLNQGAVADTSMSWAQGVLHAQQFNTQELDVHREDHFPESMLPMWHHFGRLGVDQAPGVFLPLVKEANLDEAVDVARRFTPEPLTPTPLAPRRRRHYATHAPFVYCTNMFRFFETRYEREFAFNGLHYRSRMARDLFIPFVYNAFVMARPWQASPKFLPYLLELHRARTRHQMNQMPDTKILLDNFDGCAPASLRGGAGASECTYGKFLDNLTLNQVMVDRIASTKPLYFNINAGFSSAEAADQLRRFLHDKFPTPVYLESKPPAETADPGAADEGAEDDKRTTTTVSPGDAALSGTFERLMALPVVGLVSYEEGSCPLVRSLALAFAEHHRGRVHLVVQSPPPHEGNVLSLRDLRVVTEHRIFSAMPAPTCAYNERVTSVAAVQEASFTDMVERALEGAEDAAVELPSTCGAHGAEVRVRGFVIDARTPGAPPANLMVIRTALAVPGQTLALEDFRAVPVGPGERDVVLVLSREDAVAKAVHWITGASENDLLATFPLPLLGYEDMSAPLRWSQP